MNNTKAIVFDAYGTLFDVNSAAEKCKDKIGDKWETFANYWRTTQLEYTWLRSLMKRHKDFWQITEDSLDCLLYTSDAADDLTRVDLGGRRIIKKKIDKTCYSIEWNTKPIK